MPRKRYFQADNATRNNVHADSDPDRRELPEIVKVYVYRHLLKNIQLKGESAADYERRHAPRVRGHRPAALLARLWANEDLNLDRVKQAKIAKALGIDTSGAGEILTDLAQPGPDNKPCVEIVSNPYGAEKVYRITAEGKEQLRKWILAHYTHESFDRLIKEIAPNAKNLSRTVKALQGETLAILKKSEP